MSFSQKCKNELARKMPDNQCCQLAELSALIRLDGTILLGFHQSLGLRIDTENAAVARKVIKLTKTLFNLNSEAIVQRRRRLRKNNVYGIEIRNKIGVQKMLQKTGVGMFLTAEEENWQKESLKKACCQKAYLRGVFLGGGSISNPQSGSYHLEMVMHDPGIVPHLCGLMTKFGLDARQTTRKKAEVIYLKEADQIVQFLNITGAHTALLNFESVRIYKDIRNNVNRLVNFETANLTKSVEASMRQIEAIQLIAGRIGLERLSFALKELAQARLEHPDVSLKELGELLDPPVNKSAVNHRMRRLEQFAERLRKP